MILKASAANGSSSSAGARQLLVRLGIDALDRRDVERRRQVVDDRVEQQLDALVLERRAARAPARACPAIVALAERGARARSAVGSLPSRYFAISSSSTSAPASIIVARAARRASSQLGGDRPIVGLGAELRRRPRSTRLHRDQVDDAREARPRRRAGAGSATGVAPRRSRICVDARGRKSAPTRSILLMNAMRGTRYLSAWRQTVSVCGSTPLTAVRTPRPRRRARAGSARPRW